MLKKFYRWLYHRRQARAAKQRLSGKPRITPKWHRFSYTVFQQAKFGKYDLPEIRARWALIFVGVPLSIIALWFVWQSIQALGMFQP
ncbi:hypothetical protein [Rubellicoccus peritrichatus]|uniref:Uncharacterized protein n=1 Tax=Rubellicoccus peritrichatus TaxID=3080537 RepID=A0AAQ3QY51_9BACT|nr:hypothetical protein [Puniceicoccus sp. CR14]WOO43470.1 hypothetical protein RZN69_10250 [Puniceicoccus sp. CR14]